MLGVVNSAAMESGRVAGHVIFCAALLAGALKCWFISRRPTTNTKCALSLMLLLLGFLVAGGGGTLLKAAGPSPASAILAPLLGIMLIPVFGAAVVLAILGLVELARAQPPYVQGRAQAIWTLALAGLIGVSVAVNVIRLAHRSYRGLAAQSQPGKVLTFADLNFQFRSPERPWLAYDTSKINPNSQLSFMRRSPEAYFFIMAEKTGARANVTSQQLADFGKARLMAASAARVLSEAPLRVGNLDGLLVEADAEVGAYRLHYRNWYCATNGFAYQLDGYSRVEDQTQVADDLAAMLSRFELIDPNRVASGRSGAQTNFYSPGFGYAVMLTNSAWYALPSLGKAFPLAEFGGSEGDSCFVVVPVHLPGEDPGTEALTTAFLATMGVAYPNENLTGQKVLSDGDRSGRQFDLTREVEGKTFHYRFQIWQGRGEAYLISVWSQRHLPDAEGVFADVFARFKFLPAPNSLMLLSTARGNPEREDLALGFVLNQAGLYHSKQGDFEKALALFRSAARASHYQEAVYIRNALETWPHLDRPKEALAFLDTLSSVLLKQPQIRADQAWFQARASLTEQSVSNYAQLFASGYRSDSHFGEYLSLLADQKQYDEALTAIHDYTKVEDSVLARMWEAQIYRKKKDNPRAIALLKELRRKAPFNLEVASALAETYIAAGQWTDALDIGQEMVKDDNSATAYFLKGRSELGLKWYREAKISLAGAAKLAPTNKDIRSYLDYVSGLLGEGENTALMEAIEPVPLPAILTNAPSPSAPAGFATNYGSYFVRRIVATAHVPAREYKTTEFMLARMLDPAGVSAFSTVQIDFDPLSEQVFVNEVRVMDADGKTVSTGNAANYYVLDEHLAGGASQKKVLNIPVPGLQPGCELAVTITRRQQGRLEEFPFVAHTFAGTVPVLDSVFFLAGDARDLAYRTSPPLEPQKLPEGLCWRLTNAMVIRWEPEQPPLASFVPMLWISDAAAQWPKLVSNYLASISDRLQPDPGVESEARRLTGKLATEDLKLAVLASYVQTNLTYKAIEFGRRARLPNPSADILRNKYGDCKDHALLLQQMLVAAGVPARLALASLRSPIQENLPSLDQFDHMIVYVPGGGGHFLDCTSKGADVARAIPQGLAGRDVLVLDAAAPRFVPVPQYPANASAVSVVQHVQLADQSDAKVEEALTLSGVSAAAMREYLLSIPESSRRTTLQKLMGMDDVDLTDFQADALGERSVDLHLHFNYCLKRQFRNSNGELRGMLKAGFARSYLMANPVDPRLTPFEITLPLAIDFKIIVEAPAGFQAGSSGNADARLNPHFLTGGGEVTVLNGQFELRFKCQQLTGRFAASDYADYRQAMAQALSCLEREVVFKAR